MPSLEQSYIDNLDMSSYRETIPERFPVLETQEPVIRNPFLRCPVPPIGHISPDNLDQFYLHGKISQFRVFIK